jgi:hypothetical protein
MRYSAISEQLKNATVDPSVCAGLVGNAHLEGDSSNFSAQFGGKRAREAGFGRLFRTFGGKRTLQAHAYLAALDGTS